MGGMEGALHNRSLRWYKVGWRFSEGFEGQRWVIQEGRGVPVDEAMVDPASGKGHILVPPLHRTQYMRIQ